MVVRIWRDSKAVMPRPAKPFSPVRLRIAPPNLKDLAIARSFLLESVINFA